MIRVAVVGATGRMGREALRALTPERGFSVVAVSRTAGTAVEGHVTTDDIEAALADAHVLLELGHRETAASNALLALEGNVSPVIGTTGLAEADVVRIAEAAIGKGAMLVPNFAIGAVLMMRFAELAARWMPDAEVIERHHERKEDAPSGTALATAARIAAARGVPTPLPAPHLKLTGARGADAGGVPVHSLRLPGSLAHQEVLFGGPGETLTLRHDSLDRSSFAAGMRLCCERVRELDGLVHGMDRLLGLE